eukprot:15257839-Alexandrium_andersonii.AAC.1
MAARLTADIQAGRHIDRVGTYEATWRATHEHEAEAWLVRNSRDRRLWPTDAGKWSVLKELADFAAATH